MKKFLSFFVVLGFLAAIYACRKDQLQGPTRSFYMGTTPWPPDFTKRGYDLAYDFIEKDCDLISHHFDDGVPWEEAYSHLPMPSALMEDVDRRIKKTPAGKKVLLSVAALDVSRRNKSYYNKSTLSDQFATAWKNKAFNDSTIIKAYVNYISFLYDQLHPDFINFGVESNSGAWEDAPFKEYKAFLAQVYSKLKVLYPNTPLFVSFMVTDDPKFLQRARELDSVTDWVTLSAYPYSYVGSPVHGSTSPSLIPENLFQSYLDINSSKACAIAETGYIAEDLNMSIIQKEGNTQWQEDYVNYLFSFCQKNKAKFIIWFCPYDYTPAVSTFKALGATDELFLLWEHTGFYDEKLVARPSYQAWSKVLKLRVKP
jgi:hypothetical protein